MRLIEGHEYATIKNHRIIIIDGEHWNWIPNCILNHLGVIPAHIKQAYLETMFKVETKKPYPARYRMRVSGIFESFLTLKGYREIEVWKADLIFYTCIDGVLLPNARKKVAKIKIPGFKRISKKRSEAAMLALDLADDLVSAQVDIDRDRETDFE